MVINQPVAADLKRTRRWLIIALCMTTAIKFSLAVLTFGTNDVVSWADFMRTVQKVGAGVYLVHGVYGEPFNQPPFIAHVLRLIGFFVDKTPTPFPLVLRTPAILSDIGSVVITYRLSRNGVLPYSLSGIIAMAISPVSILIAGFHGNTDPVMVCFLLLTLYLLEVKSIQWASGLAFGMAINIKVVPLIFVPAIFYYLESWSARIVFFTCAFALVLISWMPYLAQEPLAIVRDTLGYKGFPAAWGFSNLLSSRGPSQNPLPYTLLRWTIIAVAVVIPPWLRKRKNNLFTQFGVVILLFYFLTPALGVQYFAWAVPFVLFLGLGWAISYYFCVGALLFALYNYWSRGGWYYAESHLQPSWDRLSSMLAFLCWALIGLMLIRYKHLLLDSKPSSRRRASAPSG